MFSKAFLFLKEARQELARVNWPTPRETMRLTVVVVVISLLFAAFLGALDFLFVGILSKYLL